MKNKPKTRHELFLQVLDMWLENEMQCIDEWGIKNRDLLRAKARKEYQEMLELYENLQGKEYKCMRKKTKPYMIYGIVDLTDNQEPLIFTGTKEEVADYAGLKNPKSVINQIYRAKIKGQRCRYVRLGYEDEEE